MDRNRLPTDSRMEESSSMTITVAGVSGILQHSSQGQQPSIPRERSAGMFPASSNRGFPLEHKSNAPLDVRISAVYGRSLAVGRSDRHLGRNRAPSGPKPSHGGSRGRMMEDPPGRARMLKTDIHDINRTQALL